jgi:hypothetical protein
LGPWSLTKHAGSPCKFSLAKATCTIFKGHYHCSATWIWISLERLNGQSTMLPFCAQSSSLVFVLHVTLPWMQLTALTLRDPTPSSCAAILRQASNVVHCELWIKSSYIWPNNTLPYLESLILKDWGCKWVPEFRRFLVPTLRSLEVPANFLGPNPSKFLTSFMSKSGCHLQELHITAELDDQDRSLTGVFPLIPKISFGKPSHAIPSRSLR